MLQTDYSGIDLYPLCIVTSVTGEGIKDSLSVLRCQLEMLILSSEWVFQLDFITVKYSKASRAYIVTIQ